MSTDPGLGLNDSDNEADKDDESYQALYQTDPVSDILDSALPHAEKMERLVDLFYAAGDMDFRDYLPHEVLGDYQNAVVARIKARQEAEVAAGTAGR